MTDQVESYADTLEGQLLIEAIEGGMFLTHACRAIGLDASTIYKRMRKDPKFAQRMDDARDLMADQMAATVPDVITGKAGVSSGDVKRDRLIAEYTMKLLAVWHRKRYGQHLEIEQKTATVAIPVGDDPVAAQRAYEQFMKGH